MGTHVLLIIVGLTSDSSTTHANTEVAGNKGLAVICSRDRDL